MDEIKKYYTNYFKNIVRYRKKLEAHNKISKFINYCINCI